MPYYGLVAALYAGGTPVRLANDGTVTRTWLWPKQESEELGSCSGRRRRMPILQRFASELAERVTGNKVALNVERIVDGGVNG
jgi:hypothetical protein